MGDRTSSRPVAARAKSNVSMTSVSAGIDGRSIHARMYRE